MDSFYGSNQPFMNLLNSQETPISNSQIHLSQLNFTQESHRTPITHNLAEKRKQWSPTHDVILCSAWLNTSKDAIVANEQRNSAFWDRVADYFNACPEINANERRNGVTCKSRWAKINEGVSKFAGAFETATRNKRSGENEDNIKSNALKIYKQDNNKVFNLEHAWLELRNEQKWCASLAANVSSSLKRKLVDDDEVSSLLVDEVREERPIGVKASKRISKKKRTETSGSEFSNSALEAYNSMIALKEKELAMKKEASNRSMLDSLLAKSSLTDLETKLKEKLILQILDE